MKISLGICFIMFVVTNIQAQTVDVSPISESVVCSEFNIRSFENDHNGTGVSDGLVHNGSDKGNGIFKGGGGGASGGLIQNHNEKGNGIAFFPTNGHDGNGFYDSREGHG